MMSEKKRYAMVIDTAHCVGCQTCTISCKVCNGVSGGTYWNHVESLDGENIYQPTGKFPTPSLAFRPVLCNHCVDAPCVNNCPTPAMQKDVETGIVSVRQQYCIGCGYCRWSCPYNAPMMDEEVKLMSKCNFCEPRVKEGKEPYCVESCPANVRFFGDLNDPSSEVVQLIQKHKGLQYKPEMGTNPSVFYL